MGKKFFLAVTFLLLNFPLLPQTEVKSDFISANQINMWISNNGSGSNNPETQNWGFLWPGGDNATKNAIMQDGLIYGGKINESLIVNGNYYRQGLQPGPILSNGSAANPNDSKYKVWKIKKDWEFLPAGDERDSLEYNYNNWPVELGAPWKDLNGDGVYTPGTDQPDFIGDEVLFYVANDLVGPDSYPPFDLTKAGLEFQVTVWGQNSPSFLQNVVFKKYKFINKGNHIIDSLYLTYWADDDLGNAADDYTGCDTVLNLGYTYNGRTSDEIYGSEPPAVGHMLIQGPNVIGNPSDSAFFYNSWHNGYKNLNMSAFSMYMCGVSQAYCSPSYGIEGAKVFYNNMHGLANNGMPYIDPNTNDTTKYCLSGDPEEGTGWYEGKGWPGGFAPGDRYNSLTAGPLIMAPGDTQEVVIAILMAQGNSNLNSVTELKKSAANIRNFYYGKDIPVTVENNKSSLLKNFSLSQNYPNPFNPSTIIQYNLAEESFVQIIVFDILGKEITRLINQKQNSGNYTITFDGSKLVSGFYIYQLRAGNYLESKKMMLIK